MELKSGDIVQLRSGGPLLTLLGVEGEKARCVFYSDEIGDFREAVLPLVALELLELDDEEAVEDEGDEDEDEDED